jgi:hypothetical protein
MLIQLIQLIFAMAHIANGIIYFHCYKMWVQFTGPCSMVIATKCGCNSLVPVQWLLLQNVGAIHWSLCNGYWYKMWVQFTGPVQWSLFKM